MGYVRKQPLYQLIPATKKGGNFSRRHPPNLSASQKTENAGHRLRQTFFYERLYASICVDSREHCIAYGVYFYPCVVLPRRRPRSAF